MKLRAFTLLTSSGCLALLLASPASAIPTASSAYTIADNYIGADDNGYGDVIGRTRDFQIKGMDVSLSGSILSVSISTTFAGKGDNGLFAGYTNTAGGMGKGIGYGDLFLSNKWTPYGSAADGYINDDASNGTSWTYGFSLTDRWMTEGTNGTGTLYQLAGDNSDILLSEDFLSGATYRNGQEVAVDTSKATALGNAGGWDIDAVNQLVNFEIDLAGTGLDNGSEIALRWEFTCANDVIEGAYSVPEPNIAILLGIGLAGMGLASRRKARL